MEVIDNREEELYELDEVCAGTVIELEGKLYMVGRFCRETYIIDIVDGEMFTCAGTTKVKIVRATVVIEKAQ